MTEVNRDAEATAASLLNLYSVSALQRKQVIVEGNDGQQKNEEALNVYCNYGSLWMNSCYFRTEEWVDVELEQGAVGL